MYTEVNKMGGKRKSSRQLIVEKTELSVLGDEGLKRMLDSSTRYKIKKKGVCFGFLISLAIIDHINNIVDMLQVNQINFHILV